MSKFSRGDLYRILAQPLTKRIDQSAVEQWSSAFWNLRRRGVGVDEARTTKPFVMMFPPPNITGNLHLGHALTGAIQDALVRHRRMQGSDSLFIPGFDHAGLATQAVVEKLLWKQQGITRKEFGRDNFARLVDEWKKQKLCEMRAQLKSLGFKLNHNREYFTMDQNSTLAVQTAFKHLFKKGLIYRSTKPIFWSDSLQTTLSDIEVEYVGGCYKYIRTGEIVEKKSLSQWFINTKSMARRAVEVVQNGQVEMIPPNYKRSWSAWLLENGAQDWCISRQSWWGHRIPAYKAASATDIGKNWVIADSISEAEYKLGHCDTILQDPDVLDTWFSSSLLPLTVSGWPVEEKFENNFQNGCFPLHIMETGFDILTFWVSKMVMISLTLTEKVPFTLILLHGMICDSDGKKMSKSLGNVIDPTDVINGAKLDELKKRTSDAHTQGILDDERLKSAIANQERLFPKGIPPCGADGLRAYLLSHDIQEEIVRLVDVSAHDGHKINLKMVAKVRDSNKLDSDDQQVLLELARCVSAAHQSFNETYQLQHCFTRLEKFLTEHLSQNYLARSKSVLVSASHEDAEKKKLKLEVFASCMFISIKILHPFMPHLSEFLYQKLAMQCSEPNFAEGDEAEPRFLDGEQFPKYEEWLKWNVEDLNVGHKLDQKVGVGPMRDPNSATND